MGVIKFLLVYIFIYLTIVVTANYYNDISEDGIILQTEQQYTEFITALKSRDINTIPLTLFVLTFIQVLNDNFETTLLANQIAEIMDCTHHINMYEIFRSLDKSQRYQEIREYINKQKF